MIITVRDLGAVLTHYMWLGTPTVATIKEAESRPLSKATLGLVLDEMTAHASEPL